MTLISHHTQGNAAFFHSVQTCDQNVRRPPDNHITLHVCTAALAYAESCQLPAYCPAESMPGTLPGVCVVLLSLGVRGEDLVLAPQAGDLRLHFLNRLVQERQGPVWAPPEQRWHGGLLECLLLLLLRLRLPALDPSVASAHDVLDSVA